MKGNKSALKSLLRRFIFITIGAVLVAYALEGILIPNNIIEGGVTSGLRNNSAADDAAGLGILEKMRKQNIFIKNTYANTDINNKYNCAGGSPMIEGIFNQAVPSPTRVTAVDKVNPYQQNQHAIQNTEQQSGKYHQEALKDKMEKAVKSMNDFIQPLNTSIKFVLHDRLNSYYVKVIDDNTNQVIKEIPAKKLLDTYADMMERIGLLVDKKI